VSSIVLDSSAVLTVILDEPGRDRVSEAIEAGAFVSSVNLTEIVTRLIDLGSPEPQIRAFVESLKIEVQDFLEDHAWSAALLRRETRTAGLSLGDRACLALAAGLRLPVMTADRNWAAVNVGVEINFCR
jgi:PIN domain nuclease of toxin-antitoxin system